MNQDFNNNINNNQIAELNARQLAVERDFRLWYNQLRLAERQRLMSFQQSTTATQQQQQQQTMLARQQRRTPTQQQYRQGQLMMMPGRQQDMVSPQQPMMPNQPSTMMTGQPVATQHQSMGSSPQSMAFNQPLNVVAHQPGTPQQLLTPEEPCKGHPMATQYQGMGSSPDLAGLTQSFDIMAHQHNPSPQQFIAPNQSSALMTQGPMAQYQGMGSTPQHPMMLAQQPPMSAQYPTFPSPTQQVPMAQHAPQYQPVPVSQHTSMGLPQNQHAVAQLPMGFPQNQHAVAQLPMGFPQNQHTGTSQYPHLVQARSQTPSPPQSTYKDILKQALLVNKRKPKTKITPTKSSQSKNPKSEQPSANDRKRKTQAGPTGPKKNNGPQEEDERPAKRHKSTPSVPVASEQTGTPSLRLETDAQNKAHVVKDTADSVIYVNKSPDFLLAASRPVAQASSPIAREVPDIDQDDSDTDEIPLPPPEPVKTPRVYKQKESTQGRMAAPDVAPRIAPQPVRRPAPQSAPYVTPEVAAEVAAEIVAEVAAEAARGAALEHALELATQDIADIAPGPAPGNPAEVTTGFNFQTGDEIDPELETETALPTFFEDAFASFLQDSEYYTPYQPANALQWPSAPAPRRIHKSATDKLLSMTDRQVLYQRGNRMYAIFNNDIKVVAHADTRMGRRIWVDPETGQELESIDRGQGMPLEGENGAFVGFAGSRGAALMYGAGGLGLDK